MLGLQRDRRFAAGPRAIVECSHRVFGHGALEATLDGLVMESECPTDRKKTTGFPVGQQYPRRSTRLAGSVRDCAIDLNFAVSASPGDNSIARRHAAMTPFTPFILGTRDLYTRRKTQRNPPIMTTFMESVV
jgi:hypothetical protein